MAHKNLLLIDNRDSFVEILADQFRRNGATLTVRKPGTVAASEITKYDALVISPGPGTPSAAHDAHRMLQTAITAQKPILGVCLGHQMIAEHYGAKITVVPEPRHGETSTITHAQNGIFNEVPQNIEVMRYHSLTVAPTSIPNELELTAQSSDGTVMALRHRSLPINGVQFHPESILSQAGDQIISNWLTQID